MSDSQCNEEESHAIDIQENPFYIHCVISDIQDQDDRTIDISAAIEHPPVLRGFDRLVEMGI